MRDLPEGLAVRLDSGAATLCHAWLVTLTNGARLGFTDHDGDLEIEGVICQAACGWTTGAAHAELGLEPGLAAATGILDVDGPTEADIDAGDWDEAEVETWRVDWSEPALRVNTGGGFIERIRRDGGRLTLDVRGPLSALDRVVGRTFSRLCDARLGDARCGADLTGVSGAACDKRFETCRATFFNAVNFRGFPDVPGDDFLVARPAEGGRHDGGSRR